MSMEEHTPTEPRPTRPPKQEVSGGVYAYTWEEEQVQVIVQRIREDSRHTPSAEIRIRGKAEGHIHTTRINLLSTQARNQVARHCASRCTAGRDWDAIVEQFTVMTLDHWRQGEPVVNLGTVKPPPEPIYRLTPLLLEGETTLIYGDGGIGKSYIAAYLASQVDQGIKMGKYTPIQGKVLYLDYETNREIAARRFQAITRGFGFSETSGVLYRFCFQPLAADIAEIQKIVAEEDIEFIVVDSAGPACGGDPESASSAINYFTSLRSLRKTTLTIAHRSKSGSVGPFGSVYWVNYPRATYELKKSQEMDDDVMHVALIHKKANEGRLQEPISFKFTFRLGSVTVAEELLEDVPGFVGELPIAEQLFQTLQEYGPQSARDLASLTGLQLASIHVILSRDPRFKRVGSSKWDAA
tara:strand:+ start:392 stop:1624 length:1233 start_codon:yes stop_codon:yes gene_type:complete